MAGVVQSVTVLLTNSGPSQSRTLNLPLTMVEYFSSSSTPSLPRALVITKDQGQITSLFRVCSRGNNPLWARETLLSSRARVTSTNSHLDLHLPSAGDQLSEFDHSGRWNWCSLLETSLFDQYKSMISMISIKYEASQKTYSNPVHIYV